MRGTNKVIGGLLGLLLLAGCGVTPGTVMTQGEGTTQAYAKSKFKYALGADVSKDPGVACDESYQIQALPEVVDLRPNCSPVANQGEFGSCTSFATVKGLQEYLLKKAGRYVPQAPAYVWYQSRRQIGEKGQDSGVPTEFAVKMLDSYGSIPETEFPYLEASKQQDDVARLGFLTRQPSADQVAAAKKNRLINGYKLATKLSAVRKSLAEGMPVVVAMYVFSNMEDTPKSGLLPMPTAKDELKGGHAVLAVGYDNAKKVLIIRNSWGTGWGDKGYFYMPYEYLKLGGVRVAVVPKI